MLVAHQPWVFLAPRAVSIFNSLSALTTAALSVACISLLPQLWLQDFQMFAFNQQTSMETLPCVQAHIARAAKNGTQHKHREAYNLGGGLILREGE